MAFCGIPVVRTVISPERLYVVTNQAMIPKIPPIQHEATVATGETLGQNRFDPTGNDALPVNMPPTVKSHVRFRFTPFAYEQNDARIRE
jgi:hypothetical protein